MSQVKQIGEGEPDRRTMYPCGCERVGWHINVGRVPTPSGTLCWYWDFVCATHDSQIPLDQRLIFYVLNQAAAAISWLQDHDEPTGGQGAHALMLIQDYFTRAKNHVDFGADIAVPGRDVSMLRVSELDGFKPDLNYQILESHSEVIDGQEVTVIDEAKLHSVGLIRE